MDFCGLFKNISSEVSLKGVVTRFQIFFGWVLICGGLLSGAHLFCAGIRKYRHETIHNFSFKNFMLGRERSQKPSIQLFLEGLMGVVGSALIYFMLFAD